MMMMCVHLCGRVQGSHQGGPQLRLADVCRECLRQQLQGLVSSDYAAELREQLLAMLADEEEANAAAGRGDADMPGNYVSKTWLKGFRARQGAGGGSLQPPTAGETAGGSRCSACCALAGCGQQLRVS